MCGFNGRPLNEKWNTINDIQILGAACYNNYVEKERVKTIVVTDDRAIRIACENTYVDGDVWSLREYPKLHLLRSIYITETAMQSI